MHLNIKYFGLLAEITKCNEESFVFSKTTVSDLLEYLFNKYPELKNKDFQVAQNNNIVSKEAKLLETEIVLLPPFSGG